MSLRRSVRAVFDPHRELRRSVSGLRSERLDWRAKGLGPMAGRCAAELDAEPVRLSRLGLPLLTIDRGALQHNLHAMSRWAYRSGVLLAPHGKTTMAPALWLAQLDAGARAITVANAAQLRAAYALGVRNVQVANEVVGAVDLLWLTEVRSTDPTFQAVHWVDSVQAVDLLEAALSGRPVRQPLQLFVELGAPGGRTGARDLDELERVARRVHDSPRCWLAGVAGYEGALPDAGADASGLAAVRGYLATMAEAYLRLEPLFETGTVVLSAGGSVHFDQVAEMLGPLAGERPRHRLEVMVRSGAYLAQDHGHYQAASPARREGGPELRPALHVWTQVLSRPEPGLVLLDAGKRDLPFDLGLPVVLDASRRADDGSTTPVHVGDTRVLRLNDQHAFVEVDGGCRLAPGDVVRLGISHPCTALDRWRTIPVVDDADTPDPWVVDAVHTFF